MGWERAPLGTFGAILSPNPPASPSPPPPPPPAAPRAAVHARRCQANHHGRGSCGLASRARSRGRSGEEGNGNMTSRPRNSPQAASRTTGIVAQGVADALSMVTQASGVLNARDAARFVGLGQIDAGGHALSISQFCVRNNISRSFFYKLKKRGKTRVTARRIAQSPKATFVTRLQPFRLPGRTARQLPDQSTTLWVESSSTGDSRLRGARP
jgi:hypothetical protein